MAAASPKLTEVEEAVTVNFAGLQGPAVCQNTYSSWNSLCYFKTCRDKIAMEMSPNFMGGMPSE